MKITKLEPSQHVEGRWLCHMEDGSILRVTENEVVSFALYAGMELSPEKLGELGRAAAAAGSKNVPIKYGCGYCSCAKILL